MKFWCASSQRKSIPKSNESSFSSAPSYATISSIPIHKSDSGFSESSSSIMQPYSRLEQILAIENTHHENLKQCIIKYSRPLRRYLNPTEIVDLFQNIEKISTISKSIVRQCEKLLDESRTSNAPISVIYQSSFGVMIDSYSTYISRSLNALRTLKQCADRIAYFLQIPADVATPEITDFILVPLRHICVLNDLFQTYDSMNMNEERGRESWNSLPDRYRFTNRDLAVHFLSKQATQVLQWSYNEETSMFESSFQSEISPVIVFQRTDKEAWRSKRLNLSEWNLSFIELDRSAVSRSICLSNVIHIEEDASNEELCLLVATNTRNPSPYSSMKIKRVYVRFEERNEYCLWLHYLTAAIQGAKDQSWSKTNELVI